MKQRDPRLLGFFIGFGSVAALALIVFTAWSVLSPHTPTLVPSISPPASAEGASSTDQTWATPVTLSSNSHSNLTPTQTAAETSRAAATPTSDSPIFTSTPTSDRVTLTPTRIESIEYEVLTGDTLFDIAQAFGISVETIQADNDLQGDNIIPGQILVIPPESLPTPTPFIDESKIIHTVSSGDTLIGIAKHYSVTVQAIRTTNNLDSDAILPGWQLEIPLEDTPSADSTHSWQPSILEGDLQSAYPLALEKERFTMRYQPNTPASQAPEQVAAIVESALNHIENKLQVTLEGRFDVYVAGSLFAPDALALRGRSFSSQRRNFYLYDDTGTPDERRYIVTHELTHLVIWNTVGQPSSVMLHEGLAVYTGIEAMQAAGFIPLSQFCTAYHLAGQLPRLSGGRSYLGHIRDLDLYFAAGCFVQYLIETYGLNDFKQIFASGNYYGIYKQTLAQLEVEWIETLNSEADQLTFAPDDLVAYVAQVADAYDQLFTDFRGTSSQMMAYRALDDARIVVLQGQFDKAQHHLDEFKTFLTNQ